jgi:cyclohexyl-isocyanide hydratase
MTKLSGTILDGSGGPEGRGAGTGAGNADFPVVFALYPNITQLDFTGPYEVFTRLPGARCILAATQAGTIEAGGGMTFAGVRRLEDIGSCALLCVPGGFGTVQAMEDRQYLAELRRLAVSARYVTSVCTGSLLLAAAGLLTGKRAACHWAWRDSLAAFGAVPDPARVVRAGNVITGSVTAGIDMALTVLAEIAGVDYAQGVTLGIEYAPQPPFDSGRPELARPDILAAARKRSDAVKAERDAAVRRAVAALAEQQAWPIGPGTPLTNL